MFARGSAVCLGIVAFIGDHRPWRDIRSDRQQGFELTAVGGLCTGQVEVERQAIEIAFDVDFCAKSTARAAERLILLPPLAPAAET